MKRRDFLRRLGSAAVATLGVAAAAKVATLAPVVRLVSGKPDEAVNPAQAMQELSLENVDMESFEKWRDFCEELVPINTSIFDLARRYDESQLHTFWPKGDIRFKIKIPTVRDTRFFYDAFLPEKWGRDTDVLRHVDYTKMFLSKDVEAISRAEQLVSRVALESLSKIAAQAIEKEQKKLWREMIWNNMGMVPVGQAISARPSSFLALSDQIL